MLKKLNAAMDAISIILAFLFLKSKTVAEKQAVSKVKIFEDYAPELMLPLHTIYSTTALTRLVNFWNSCWNFPTNYV